jgi:hypothetical protein
MTHRIIILLSVLALLACSKPADAAQSYDNCTGFITSLPAVISTQGTWCLKQDLSTAITSGQAITIANNNVTLDCNDFKLGGLAAGLATATSGIISVNRLNSTVRHCNIRGFAYGIFFSGASGGGHVVEDNRFDGNTITGVQVDGDGSVVRRNRVFDTGASTFYNVATGIGTTYSVDVLDNTVSGVSTSGSGGYTAGIYTNANSGGRVSGNGVRGLLKDAASFTTGIYNFSSADMILRDNDVVGDSSISSLGIHCSGATDSIRDNVIKQFQGAIETCSDAGGNYTYP